MGSRRNELDSLRCRLPQSAADDKDWQRLLESVDRLDPGLSLSQCAQLEWGFLPAPPPSRSLFRRVCGLLASSVNDAPDPLLRREPSSTSHAPVGRRETVQQAAFRRTVSDFSPGQVVAELREARTAPKTARTYSAAENLYELSCERAGVQAWPATQRSLEIFAGYLKKSGAYLNPTVYFFGAIDGHKRRCNNTAENFPKAWVNDICTALERGLPPQEQCEPMTVSFFRKLGHAVSTEKDFSTLLCLVGAFFAVARADCFLHCSPHDIALLGDRVRVTLTNLKGEKRKSALEPVFEPLGALEPAPLTTALGAIRLDPTRVFSALRERAIAAAAATVALTDSYQKMHRQVLHLIQKAGILNEVEGRRRHLYSAHSTRVGAVCTLLKAGLDQNTISTLANWTSDMIIRYGRRVALDPGLVENFPFFNPRSSSGSYSSTVSSSTSSSGTSRPTTAYAEAVPNDTASSRRPSKRRRLN